MGTATQLQGPACTRESCAGDKHTGLRGIARQHLPRFPQHRPLLSTIPSAPATAAVGPFCCQLVRDQRGSALGIAPGAETRVWRPAQQLVWLTLARSAPRGLELLGLGPGGPHQLGPGGPHQPLPVPTADAGLCSLQGRHLLRRPLCAKKPILILQDLLADGALGPSMQPRRCSTVTAARHELLLSSAQGTPQCQSRANTSQHNRAQQKHRLPARRSLVAAHGDGQPARGCKKTPSAGSPTAGATAIQVPKCPRAGSTSLGCISLGAGSWLGEEERLAGSLRTLLGAAGWRGLAARPCPWEQSPPQGWLPSPRLGALQRQPGRRRRLLSNQTDHYLGSF